MNRKQRRAAAAHLTAVKGGFECIQAEGRGVWHIRIVFPWEALDLFAKAAAGEAEAGRLLLLLEQLVNGLKAADPPLLCLLCDTEFGASTVAAAFVLLMAAVDAPQSGISSGVCLACADGPDLLARVTECYRRNVIKDLRVLPTFAAPALAPQFPVDTPRKWADRSSLLSAQRAKPRPLWTPALPKAPTTSRSSTMGPGACRIRR